MIGKHPEKLRCALMLQVSVVISLQEELLRNKIKLSSHNYRSFVESQPKQSTAGTIAGHMSASMSMRAFSKLCRLGVIAPQEAMKNSRVVSR